MTSFLVAFCILGMVQESSAFVSTRTSPLPFHPCNYKQGNKPHGPSSTTTCTTVVLKDQERKDQDVINNNNNDDEVYDWNATSGRSIGSLLMQMQKQEAELRKTAQNAGSNNNQTTDHNMIQAITLDATDMSKEKEETKNRKGNNNKILSVTRRGNRGAASTVDLGDKFQDGTTSTTGGDPIPPPPEDESVPRMDSATARELDDAVTWMVSTPTARNELLRSVNVLPLPSLYASTSSSSTSTLAEPATNKTTNTQIPTSSTQTQTQTAPLRMPEHYFERISRDMRHLAVSIASSIETVDQWRTFCQQGNGGLMPLLECIREGARYINLQKNQQQQSSGSTSRNTKQDSYFSSSSSYQLGGSAAFLEQHEESFMAACSACRALRDLCAVSPELSAVITDGILRANAAWSVTTTSTNHRSPVFNDADRDNEDDNTRKTRAQVHQYGNNLMHDFMTMLRYANEFSEPKNKQQQQQQQQRGKTTTSNPFLRSRNRRDARLRCKLYVTQLLLAMTVSSDDAVEAIRDTEGLAEAILKCSSYSRGEQTRRWLRYPGEIMKFLKNKRKRGSSSSSSSGDGDDTGKKKVVRPFVRAAEIQNNLDGHVRRTSNQILAAIGYNNWVPKIPGQKGLRILCLDGGGSRGMVAVSLVKGLVEAMDGVEVADSFDIIAGTSTGGIIAFLVGMRKESSELAVERYDALIKQIFVKTSLSTPMMLFTTATYDEGFFMEILKDILGDNIMLDSRADPSVPYVSFFFAGGADFSCLSLCSIF